METAVTHSEAKPKTRRPAFATRAGLLIPFATPRLASLLWPAALVLVGLGLRVIRLQFQPLWWDEGYSVWFATHPLGEMAALTALDIHPPLYYALLHAWISLLGAGPVALRLFSVVAGTAAIPVIYGAGRRLWGERAGRIAGLLLAINPFHVYYSQEVRMYGLVALLSAAILVAAWDRLSDKAATAASRRQSRGPGALRAYAPYVLLTTAALYTQYYAVFLPIGLTVYALWRWRGARRNLLAWLAAQAAIAVLYIPWLLYATPRLIPYVSQKVVADADRPLSLAPYLGRHLAAFVAGHLEGPLAPFWPLALLPVAAGLATLGGMAVARLRRGEGRRPWIATGRSDTPRASAVAMLGTVLLTVLALGYLISLRYPFFPARGERLLLLGLPPFLLLAAAGLNALWARRHVLRWAGWGAPALIACAAVPALAGLLALYTAPRYADDDYRPLIARTVEQGLPGDTVFCIYPWQVGYWRSYGSADGPAAVLTPDPTWGPALAATLDAALARGHVWFPAHLALGGVTESQVEAYLAERARPFANSWYGPGTRLSGWSAIAENDSHPLPGATLQFALPGSGGLLSIESADGNTGPIPAANAVVPLTLRWRAPGPPPPLAVSVRLVDALGQLWAQNDYEPLGSLGASAGPARPDAKSDGAGWAGQDALGLLIPAGTPPGRYTVEVMVRPATGQEPLEPLAADGRRLGKSGALFELAVGTAGQALSAERLPIAHPQPVDLRDGIRFLGYSAGETPLAPGGELRVTLFWQATGRPGADYNAFVQLLDRQGAPAGGWEAPPGASFATDQWPVGTLIRTQASLRPRADLPDGRYPLIAGLFSTAADHPRLPTTSGADHLTLGYITVRGRAHVHTPPAPAQPANATFGNSARLVGYDLEAQAAYVPGDVVALTLYWQAQATAPRPYTVFVHLIDEKGSIRGFGDAQPGEGQYPTTGWLPGEYLRDEHRLAVAPGTAPGTYRLAVGLYDPATGQRLITPEGKDQVLLDTSLRVGNRPDHR